MSANAHTNHHGHGQKDGQATAKNGAATQGEHNHAAAGRKRDACPGALPWRLVLTSLGYSIRLV
jgi:hypothetical protein